MRRPAGATLLAVVVVIAALSPAVATAATVGPSAPGDAPVGPASVSTGAPADLGAGVAQTDGIEADRVVLRATLDDDGDARWRIAYRIELSDDNTTAAFESLQSDIRENSSAYVSRFETRIGSTVVAAENATGREMGASDFSVTAERDPFPTGTDYGVVAYSFTWEGFAGTQGDRLVAGDALAGLYLDAGTVLTIAWPDEYEARSTAPEPDDRSSSTVTWRGERNFGPDQPRVTVAPASALPLRPAYLAAAAVVLLGIAAAVVLRRRGDLPIDADAPPEADGTAPDAATADEETDDADAAVSPPPDVDAADEGSVEGDAAPPEELLSPHERVVRLVEGNGGRMKQADVTEELGWSAARTSQVVGDLRDDGTIESFRLGRENVLRLPEADDDPHPGDPDRDRDGE